MTSRDAGTRDGAAVTREVLPTDASTGAASASEKPDVVESSAPVFAISYRHADGTPSAFHGRAEAGSYWSALRKWRAEDAEWAAQGWPVHEAVAVSLMGFDAESGHWLPVEWVPVEQLEAEADDDAAYADSLHDAGLTP